ncbi:YncE family protein [Cupriavidus alkaliphilus]|uniref:DNA-binding beta-propeller fold protein YncE n=1 Tax=Cupriavidus alkaliphilus TaxID=942866 RepID=A0A7W4V831_9BURK|nr:YncE family protein [Cupriavidus alkaliphilus]MBB3006708.1 DNA-binding beta-propeller fold protein YncE [Cupriavidus alkaliphilus]
MDTRWIAVLVEKFSHSFSGYELESGARRFSVPLPAYPHEFAVDRARLLGYVGHYGVQTFAHPGDGGAAVIAVDLARGEHQGVLDCAPWHRIHGVQTDAQGRVYALSERDNMLLVFAAPSAQQTPDRAVPSGGVKSHLFVLSRDGQRAYVTSLLSHTVTLVHPHDGTRAPLAAHAGRRPEGCCLSPDESMLYVASRDEHRITRLDAHSLAELGTADTGEDPTRLYWSPCNRLIALNYGERSLRLFDPYTLVELARVDTGAKPIALAFHPADPERAWLALNDDSVSVLDLRTLALRHAFATGKEPDGLAILALPQP